MLTAGGTYDVLALSMIMLQPCALCSVAVLITASTTQYLWIITNTAEYS